MKKMINLGLVACVVTFVGCGSGDAPENSELNGIFTSVYECGEVLNDFGGPVTLTKLSVTHGTLWSTIDIDYDKEFEQNSFTSDRWRRSFSAEKQANNQILRFSRTESAGPVFEEKWGDLFHYFDLDLSTLRVKYHTRYIDYRPGPDGSTSPPTAVNLFVAQCTKVG